MSTQAHDPNNNDNLTGAVAGPSTTTDSPGMDKEEDTSIEYLLEPAGGGNPPPNNSNNGEFDVLDEHLGAAIDEASKMFGIDYDEIFNTAGYRSLDERGEGVLGLTEYELNGIDRLNGNTAWIDDNTDLWIDESLKYVDEHELFSLDDLYHVLGHEGIHGEVFNGRYATSMREQGTPITTLMALSRKLGSEDKDEMEGATEYSARLRNPNFTDVRIHAYEDQEDEIDEYLTDSYANVTKEEEDLIQSPSSIGGLTIRYADSDGETYIEHGEIDTGDGKQEYILSLGESEKAEDYIEQHEDYADVFRMESPYDEDSGTYEAPFLEDFEKYVEDNLAEQYFESHNDDDDDYDSDDFLSYLHMLDNDQEYSLRQAPQSQDQVTEKVIGRDPGREPAREFYQDDDLMDLYNEDVLQDFRA